MQISLQMLAGQGFTHSRSRAVLSRTSPPQLGQKVRLACVLQPRLHVKASAAANPSKSALQKEIFNRTKELVFLEQNFDGNPDELLILLGPANCGKTRLLKHVKELRDAAQAVKGDGPPSVLYVDCREKDIASPQEFAKVIRELVEKDAGLKAWWADFVKAVSAGKIEGPFLEADLSKLFMQAPDKSPMNSIIDSLTTFLEALRPLPNKLVIIIDEANALMDWHDDPGHMQLKQLLRFFVRVTKQEHLGHVVLASSEYFVVDWLENEGLHTKNFDTQVIGDLETEDEAKKFVESRMACGAAPKSFLETVDDEETNMWHRVYEICGRNIGLLERCASSAKKYRSWKEGLKVVSKVPEDAVKKGLWPKLFSAKYGGNRSPAAWTKEDYKTVLREIALAKEHMHAVSFVKLQEVMDEEAVMSMVEWNLVALRPKSEWARDLPEAVFDALGDTKLVTMPSPVELHFVLKMHAREEGLAQAVNAAAELPPAFSAKFDAATLESAAADAPSAVLSRDQIIGQPLADVLVAAGQSSWT